MSRSTNHLSRRHILRSASATIALPFLQSLAGPRLLGGQNSLRSGAVGSPTTASGMPKRLVFLPIGFGVNAANWFPREAGKNYELPPLVAPFLDVKEDISFVQNLIPTRLPSPHSGTSNFLNCSPGKSKGKPADRGISCDQIAAEVIGKDTRFDYLTMGAPGRADGHGSLPSYNRDGKPVGAHRDMRSLYAALFGRGTNPQKIREQLKREESSLDAILDDAKKLNRQVSSEDRDRVDEYFTSIRNIEKRLSKAQEWVETPYPKAPFKFGDEARGPKLMELIFDMMAIAMQSDSTRILTYAMPTQLVLKGLNPHRMSHKAQGEYDPAKPTHHQGRDLALSMQVARFLKKLKDSKEADGSSILDNSLIAYGSCLRAGHAVGKGPLILAGHGGGGLNQGQNILTRNVPLANLWLSMLRHVGVSQDQFANSNGVIRELGFS